MFHPSRPNVARTARKEPNTHDLLRSLQTGSINHRTFNCCCARDVEAALYSNCRAFSVGSSVYFGFGPCLDLQELPDDASKSCHPYAELRRRKNGIFSYVCPKIFASNLPEDCHRFDYGWLCVSDQCPLPFPSCLLAADFQGLFSQLFADEIRSNCHRSLSSLIS